MSKSYIKLQTGSRLEIMHQTRLPLNDVCTTGGSGGSDGRRWWLSFSMARCSSKGDRASKVRRRYRRTEGRERRKGRGVPALTVNLRLHRVRHRREPTGRQRQLGAAGARPFGSQAKGYAYRIVIAASPMLAAPYECPAAASPSCNPASTPRTGAAPPHRRAIAPPFPARGRQSLPLLLAAEI